MKKVFLPCAVFFVLLLVFLYANHTDQTLPIKLEKKTVQSPPPTARIPSDIPDFSSFTSVSEKKKAFFAFLLPMVERENKRLSNYRQRLYVIQKQLTGGQVLSVDDSQWLLQLAKKYRLKAEKVTEPQLLSQLLIRVDAIPPSLALAQSANESAWGTSRFALQANNLFGQWCFSKGCGVVPKLRPEGATYEVASFSAPEDSVISYIHNLNTNSAYTYLRELRASLRDNQLPLSGDVLAEGLMSYSARGEAYINELRQMIRINGLARYDQTAP